MRDTRRAAEYLFDEIGGIDDSYIAAAQSAGKARTRIPFRVAMIAAAAVLVMTVTVAFPMGLLVSKDGASVEDNAPDTVYDENMHSTGNNNMFPSPSDDGSDKFYPPADGEEIQSSAFVLDSVLNVSYDSFYMGESPDLFDGTPRLLWETADGVLCGVKLSNSELEHLNREQGKGDQIGDAALEAEIKVWISYGNGLVISPYLEDSPGNVGYGELFDYSPEIIPSSAVTGRIKTIIAQHT